AGVLGREALGYHLADGDRRVEVAAGDVAEGVGPGDDREAEGEGDAVEADEGPGEHGGAAASEHEPERAEQLGAATTGDGRGHGHLRERWMGAGRPSRLIPSTTGRPHGR